MELNTRSKNLKLANQLSVCSDEYIELINIKLHMMFKKKLVIRLKTRFAWTDPTQEFVGIYGIQSRC